MQQLQPSIPQKNTYKFFHSGAQIIFDSNFDSGNMKKVVHTNPNHYSIWTASDCEGMESQGYSKSWFYFCVQGLENQVTFSIHRIQVLWSLLKCPTKYKPVYRKQNGNWQRLDNEIKSINMNFEGEIVVTFQFNFQKKEQKVYFAFTYPYSYEDCQSDLINLKNIWQKDSDFYYKQHLLINSPQKRNIDLIMISNHEGKEGTEPIIDPNILNQEKLVKYKINKPIIMITSRVHPLQTPASFCMNGIIQFLTNKNDARAYFLRKYFVFILVPMLNPDGVARGHCRMDIYNQNLNRYYQTPTKQSQPSCFAIRKLVQHYNKDKRLFFYLDLHAHPANKGNFVFGNAIFDYILQVESSLFPKLLSSNCINFDYDQCNFSRKHMKAKDRFQDMNKEGCGRVVLYRQFGIIHSYTLQCGYHTNTNNNKLNEIKDTNKIFKLKYKLNSANEKIFENETLVKQKQEGNQYVYYQQDILEDINNEYYKQQTVLYNQQVFSNLGKNILITILDIWNKNPYPRVVDPNQFRKQIAQQNSKLDRFKKEQAHLKTKQKNIITLIEQQYYQTWNKRNIFSMNKQKTVSTNQRSFTIKLASLSKPRIKLEKKQDSGNQGGKDTETTAVSRQVVKQIRMPILKPTQIQIERKQNTIIKIVTKKL